MEKDEKIVLNRCFVMWRDASYCFDEELPDYSPSVQITDGFIVKETDKYINVAVNVKYSPEEKGYWPIDGFVIPKKTILKIKRSKIKI
jgi:hypothetical protein